MEGFSRPLWALGPLLAGRRRGGTLSPRSTAAAWPPATDPQNPEYWGDPGDYDQLFCRDGGHRLRHPGSAAADLAAAGGKRKAKTLPAGCTPSTPMSCRTATGCFFRVLVNLALDSVGMPCDLALMERDLDEIDSWYVGNGWYTDGDPAVKPQRDYYIPWALQILRRIVQRLLRPGARPARAARFRQRALEFGRARVCVLVRRKRRRAALRPAALGVPVRPVRVLLPPASSPGWNRCRCRS